MSKEESLIPTAESLVLNKVLPNECYGLEEMFKSHLQISIKDAICLMLEYGEKVREATLKVAAEEAKKQIDHEVRKLYIEFPKSVGDNIHNNTVIACLENIKKTAILIEDAKLKIQ